MVKGTYLLCTLVMINLWSELSVMTIPGRTIVSPTTPCTHMDHLPLHPLTKHSRYYNGALILQYHSQCTTVLLYTCTGIPLLCGCYGYSCSTTSLPSKPQCSIWSRGCNIPRRDCNVNAISQVSNAFFKVTGYCVTVVPNFTKINAIHVMYCIAFERWLKILSLPQTKNQK